MKICTIVGARPQFIKAAAISRILKDEPNISEVIIHTGQHFDYNMSKIFFDELMIPQPHYNLGISGGTHGKMTGRMLEAIEEVLTVEMPDLLIIYGDTNSTLAGALAAVKIHIPICHIESGGRLGTLTNPEEVNRICADHVSSLLMSCTQSAVETLKREGIDKNVYLVGDPMYDAFLYFGERVTEEDKVSVIGIRGESIKVPDSYYYLTCHRAENTDIESKLYEILSAMNCLDKKTIYPVHPRNRVMAENICHDNKFNNIILVNPVGYLTSIALVLGASKIVTDSGGLQREAFFGNKQCVTVSDYIVWPETMVGNRNQLSKPNKEDILCKLSNPMEIDSEYFPFGDGHSAEKIVSIICNYLIKGGAI